MGRRKKKESSMKRSLMFEESPVESGKCPLSPVECVDNPVTAVSVPIDSDTNISWVSPQFGEITLTRGKRRPARRHHGSGKKHSATCNKENSTTARGSESHRKFPALHFIGDTAKSARKAVGLKVTARVVGGVQGLCAGEGVTGLDQDEGRGVEQQTCADNGDCVRDGVQTVGSEDYHCVETVRKRRSSFRKSVRHKHRPSLMRRSAVCDAESDSPSPSSSSPEASVPRRRSKRVSQPVTRMRLAPGIAGPVDEDDSVTAHEPVGDKRKNIHSSDILLSPCETSDLTQCNGNSTPTFTGLNPLPLRMALFAASPSEEANFNNSTANSPQLNASKSENNSACSSLSTAPRPASRRNDGAGQKRGSQGETSQDDRDTRRPRRSERLQEKYREALKYLRPQTPCKRGAVHVLVADTPEFEYHLTLRQRQQLQKCK